METGVQKHKWQAGDIVSIPSVGKKAHAEVLSATFTSLRVRFPNSVKVFKVKKSDVKLLVSVSQRAQLLALERYAAKENKTFWSRIKSFF